MENVIIYTGLPIPETPDPPTRPQESLSKAQRTVQQFFAVDSSQAFSDINQLQSYLETQQRSIGSNRVVGMDAVASFSDKVETLLMDRNRHLSLKQMLLFVFFSYMAVKRLALGRERTKILTSLDIEEKALKELNKGIKPRHRTHFDPDGHSDSENIEGQRNSIKKRISDQDAQFLRLRRELKSLNYHMKIIVDTYRCPAAADGASSDLLARIRTGTLKLHKDIAALVNKSWTPARATLAIISCKCRKHILRAHY